MRKIFSIPERSASEQIQKNHKKAEPIAFGKAFDSALISMLAIWRRKIGFEAGAVHIYNILHCDLMVRLFFK